MQSGRTCLRYCSHITSRHIPRASPRTLTRHYTTPPVADDAHSAFQRSELPKPKLDYYNIIQNLDAKLRNAHIRWVSIDEDIRKLDTIYSSYKDLVRKINAIRQEQNALGSQIQQAFKAKDSSKQNELLEQAKVLKTSLADEEKQLDTLEYHLLGLALPIPNDTHPEAPHIPDSRPTLLSTHGPPPLPASPTRDHLSICKTFNLVDFESGAAVTGRSFYYLLNEAALLEMALVQYATSIAVECGFTPVVTPDLVRTDVASRCGFQPREIGGAEGQMYRIANPHYSPNSPELVLAGTAEIPLAGMFANKIIPSNQLPVKVVGVGHAFRTEAGADNESRGLFRVHQFTKVELFTVTAEDQSEAMMESMRDLQRRIFEGLGLTFKVLDMPCEDLGASAYRKYDVEAWMPGRQKWGEISSLSNCTDYQARRLHIRYRPLTPKGSSPSQTKNAHSGPLPFAHTLNGTAAAIPRLIVALLENGAVFSENGEIEYIRLPKALKPFYVDNKRGVVRWEDEDRS